MGLHFVCGGIHVLEGHENNHTVRYFDVKSNIGSNNNHHDLL